MIDPITDLAAYLDMPLDAVEMALRSPDVRSLGKAAWESEPPDTPAASRAFYAEQDFYLHDLTAWHGLDPARAGYTDQMLAFAKDMGLRTFLDYGSGIGQDGLRFAAEGFGATLLDVPGKVRGYAEWRAERHGLAVRFADDGPLAADHDLCCLIDTLAHVSDPFAVARDMARRCRYVYYIPDWQIGTPWYPMHADKPPKFDGWWMAHFRHLAGFFWESRELNLKIYLIPNAKQFGSNLGGVLRHVEGLERHLPALGIELVGNAAEADVVHTQAISLPPPGALAHVYTNHGVYPVGPPLPPAEAKLQEAIWRNLCQADEVISVAEWPTRRYRGRLGVEPHVIPNGVDVAEWDAVPRGESGLAPGYLLWAKPTINNVCDPRPAQRLAEAMPNERFVFTLASGATPPNATVLGAMPFERMRRVLADCSVLVATTLEVFSVQTLEAMALGKPVLALRHGGDGGNNEAIVHKRTGYIAEGEADLVKGARYCLTHAERLGKAGRRRAEKLYGWPGIAERTVEVYKAALRRRQDEARRPRVSVVVPCYNAADTVGEALGSVKMQTEHDWQCVVVDDGSTDGSLAAIREAVGDDPRFVVVHQDNAGVRMARNAGLALAEGRYVSFLDADDLYYPHALRRMADFLDSRPDVFVAYPDVFAFGDVSGHWRMPEYSDDLLRQGNVMPYCSMWRRILYDRGVALMRVDPYMEDYEFWVSICSAGYKAEHIPEPLLRYRKRKGVGLSATTQHLHDEAKARMVAMHPEFWRPQVSVVIPCYKQAQYLPAAVRSVLAQTFREFEVIVVDDGSPDDVVGALAEFAGDRRVKLLRQANKGLAGARNAGIAASVGELLLTLDADDEIASTFLAKTVAVLEADSTTAIAYTDIQHTRLDGDGKRRDLNVTETRDYDFDLLLKSNLFINTALQRRVVWEAVGGYNPNMEWGYEDWNYWIDAGKRGFCGARIAEPLFRYLFKTADEGSMIMNIKPHRSEANRQMRENHKELYEGVRPMGCCGRHAFVASRPRTANAEDGPQIGQIALIDVEYMAEDPVPFSLRGAVTKAVYRNISPVVPVRQFDPRDAMVLVATDPRFRLVEA